MASTAIPLAANPLISLATDAQDGATTYGAAIGLSHNPAAGIRADLIAVIGDPAATPPVTGSRNVYHTSKSNKTTATGLRQTADRSARAFCTSCVGLLKNYLGNQWNSQWQAAGFTNGSLAIPEDTLPMLGELRGYFIANPAHENAPLGFTAAACDTRKGQLTAARADANQSVIALGTAKAANDAALKQLYTRMTGLRAELDQLLPDDDPRWYAFGFDRPADGTRPGPVSQLVLTPGGPGMVFADWDDARRAERYRVFKQITGVDAAPVEVTGTASNSEYTLTGLPSGATVQITIRAANSSGDGPVSEMVSVTVP